jgi:hypothetical protein
VDIQLPLGGYPTTFQVDIQLLLGGCKWISLKPDPFTSKFFTSLGQAIMVDEPSLQRKWVGWLVR